MVEVGQELKAQHPAQADRHVGVAGKIEVQVQGRRPAAPSHAPATDMPPGTGQAGVPQLAQVIGDQQLLGHAHHEDLHAGGELLRGAGALVDLLPQVLVLDDGAGDQLGEQGDEGAEVQDTYRWARASPRYTSTV